MRKELLATMVLAAVTACGSSDIPKPTAMVAAHEDTATGADVTLDGSGSSGGTLTYTWTQTSAAPDACNVSLDTSNPSQPRFDAPSTPCHFTFSLVVDNGRLSDPATVSFSSWKDTDADKKIFVGANQTYTTITEAITAAAPNGASVYVAAGTYTEDIAMVEGVSVYGGYDATTWTRDTSVNVSIINPAMVESEETTGTIIFGPGLTPATSIDGFTITGPAPASDGEAYTIVVRGGSASGTIANNVLNGGSATGDDVGVRTIWCNSAAADLAISGNTITLGNTTGTSAASQASGIFLYSCTSLITGNTLTGHSDDKQIPGGVFMIIVRDSDGTRISGNNNIDAGVNTATTDITGSTGIAVAGASAVTIDGNHVNGGSGATITGDSPHMGSVGISVEGTLNTTITNNIVFAGTGSANGPFEQADNASIFIRESASANIVNNTIYSGTASGFNYTACIANDTSGNVNLVNNIMSQSSSVTASRQIVLTRTDIPGVHEAAPFVGVYNNDFYVMNGGYYYAVLGNGPPTKYSESGMETTFVSEGTLQGSNISDDPLFESGSDYILSAGSPCETAGCASPERCGNITPPTSDYNGNPRSGSWSIGAYQRQ